MMILQFKYKDGSRALFHRDGDQLFMEELTSAGTVRTIIPFSNEQATELKDYLESQGF